GNTQTVLGLYRGDELIVDWRVGTHRHYTSDEYAIVLKDLLRLTPRGKIAGLDGVAISCVVPPMLPVMDDVFRKYYGIEPLMINAEVDSGVPLLVDNPSEVGADRIVNAVAGFGKYGGPLIIVDFGTATTFDVISRNGEFLGGAITPGISISLDALFHQTAKLPKVELVRPKEVIGKNTISVMQSGIYYGYVGLVDGIVKRMKTEMKEEATVIATGGYSSLLAPESETVDHVDPYLTLEGLRIIYRKLKGR
ncbi:MAG: type III pantothenate kinase, partial [Nitrospinota bacterium]